MTRTLFEDPQLAAARVQYTHARDAADALLVRAEAEARDLTADELSEVEQHSRRARHAAARVEQLEAHQTRSRAVELAAHAVAHGEPVPGTAAAAAGPGRRASDVPTLLPGAAQLAEMVRAASTDQGQHRWTVGDPVDGQTQHRPGAASLAGGEVRAAVTLTGTGTPVTSIDGRPLTEPRRIAVAAGLPVTTVTGVSGAVYPIFGDADSADVVAENALKPEYDAVTSGTATPQVIALWTDFTRQVDLTLPAFASRLRAKLAARVARREDVLMVARVLATSGIQSYTAPAAQPFKDSLLAAAALVMSSDVASAPNLAVINPADIVAIFGGSATGADGTTPAEELRLNLHGLTVYPSTAVAAGTALVGAWAAAAEYVVGMRPTVLIDSMSGLKNNRITMLMEEAVTLAVTEPAGFVNVDFVPA
jgi:hypothetical protein